MAGPVSPPPDNPKDGDRWESGGVTYVYADGMWWDDDYGWKWDRDREGWHVADFIVEPTGPPDGKDTNVVIPREHDPDDDELDGKELADVSRPDDDN